MSKILLTGGAGYIGSHVAVELLEAGYDIVVADNFYNCDADVPERITRITGRDFPTYDIDIANRKALEALFAAEEHIDGVIHMAGYKAVGESVAKPLMYYRNNLDTTLTLLEVMQEYDCKNMVFSSSATVYSAAGGAVPFSEDMPVGCINPYGWTKFMIEQMMSDLAAADPDVSMLALRYFNPVGAHESGLIGEQPKGMPNNLMPYILRVAAGESDVLHVFGGDYPTPDGTGVRDYIHIVDLARGHVKALEYAIKHRGHEVINLGTGRGYSVLELVQAFERANGVKVAYVMDDRRPGDMAECYADTKKAERLLGWHAEKTLDDICRDAWHWKTHGK